MRTKAAAAEEAAAAVSPGAVLGRTSLIYGGPEPSDHERRALDGAFAFYEDEWRCPAQVDDLAAAVLELAGRPEIAGPLHVTGPERVSRLKFARLVVAAAGGDPATVRSARRRADRPGDLALDCSRAAALLRTRLRGVREALATRA